MCCVCTVRLCMRCFVFSFYYTLAFDYLLDCSCFVNACSVTGVLVVPMAIFLSPQTSRHDARDVVGKTQKVSTQSTLAIDAHPSTHFFHRSYPPPPSSIRSNFFFFKSVSCFSFIHSLHNSTHLQLTASSTPPTVGDSRLRRACPVDGASPAPPPRQPASSPSPPDLYVSRGLSPPPPCRLAPCPGPASVHLPAPRHPARKVVCPFAFSFNSRVFASF